MQYLFWCVGMMCVSAFAFLLAVFPTISCDKMQPKEMQRLRLQTHIIPTHQCVERVSMFMCLGVHARLCLVAGLHC